MAKRTKKIWLTTTLKKPKLKVPENEKQLIQHNAIDRLLSAVRRGRIRVVNEISVVLL